MQLPKRRNIRHAAEHEDAVVYLTPAGIRKLDDQILRLKEYDEPVAIKDVSEAVQKGDLSENAEYQEARGRLTRIQNRIVSLEARRKRVVAIESGGEGVVEIGSTVTVQNNDGSEKQYEIVGPSETNPSRGRISYLSPIGSVLLKKAVGDTVRVFINGSEKTLTIAKVE